MMKKPLKIVNDLPSEHAEPNHVSPSGLLEKALSFINEAENKENHKTTFHKVTLSELCGKSTHKVFHIQKEIPSPPLGDVKLFDHAKGKK